MASIQEFLPQPIIESDWLIDVTNPALKRRGLY